MSKLRIGTCSWKYDSWKGIIYSDKPEINYLEEYSKYFNTVEIDQWFWSLGKKSIKFPRPIDVRSYANSIPEDFKFTIKMPNSITLTHYYKQTGKVLEKNPYFLSNELAEQFLYSIIDIKDNVGPLMFQFEYLNKQKMPSQDRFLELLEKFISSLPKNKKWGLEIRNPNYLNKKYFEFLNRNSLTHVFLHGYYMPPIYETYHKFKNYINGTVVLRLHGPDRQGIEKKTNKIWDEIVSPKDDELHKIVLMIVDLLSKGVDVYLNVNNHYEGSAPKTIRKITDILDKTS